MQAFTDFAVISGGAAAALTGLLFVAVSIRAEQISRSVELRSRIAGILTLFLLILTTSICVALPNAAPWVLGVELLVATALAGAAFIVLDARAERAPERAALARVLDRLNPNLITTALVGLAGLALLLNVTDGLFLLALATVVAFVGGVIGAWLVLVRAMD